MFGPICFGNPLEIAWRQAKPLIRIMASTPTRWLSAPRTRPLIFCLFLVVGWLVLLGWFGWNVVGWPLVLPVGHVGSFLCLSYRAFRFPKTCDNSIFDDLRRLRATLSGSFFFQTMFQCSKEHYFEDFSPIAMLWGLAKLIGGRAPSGHRQIWWADGVPVML